MSKAAVTAEEIKQIKLLPLPDLRLLALNQRDKVKELYDRESSLTDNVMESSVTSKLIYWTTIRASTLDVVDEALRLAEDTESEAGKRSYFLSAYTKGRQALVDIINSSKRKPDDIQDWVVRPIVDNVIKPVVDEAKKAYATVSGGLQDLAIIAVITWVIAQSFQGKKGIF